MGYSKKNPVGILKILGFFEWDLKKRLGFEWDLRKKMSCTYSHDFEVTCTMNNNDAVVKGKK